MSTLMTKTAKKKEILSTLTAMIAKEAQAGQASGVPGKDTNITAISDKHDTTDKNSVGADKNKPQDFNQQVSSHENRPHQGTKAGEATSDATTTAPEPEKAAEEAPVAAEPAQTDTANADVQKLGSDLLAIVEKFAKQQASGKPGADTNYQAVSEKHDSVDKNNVGADKNKPQQFDQKPSTDGSKPVAKAAEQAEPTQEDINKAASFALGQQIAAMIAKQAAEQEIALAKEAGRRDFELLISQAAQELDEQGTKTASAQDDEAEKLGAETFDSMMKQARFEYAITELAKQVEELKQKSAQLEQEKIAAEKRASEAVAAKEAEAARIIAEQREAQKWAGMAEFLKAEIINELKNSVAR